MVSELKARGPKRAQLRSLEALAVVFTHGVPEALGPIVHSSRIRVRPPSQSEGDCTPQCTVCVSPLSTGRASVSVTSVGSLYGDGQLGLRHAGSQVRDSDCVGMRLVCAM